MQVAPSKELLPFIKHYLFLDRKGMGINKLRLFSDGNMGMVFSFKGDLIGGIQGNQRIDYLPNSFVYGQISEFKNLYSEKNVSLIAVVFQPDGINRLSGIPAHEMKDRIIGIKDIFGLQGLMLQEKLHEEIDPETKSKLLNTFFLNISSTHP